MIDTVRQLIDTHGNLRAPALILTPDADLYAVELTPFAAIQVALALEEAFDVEFPARMLRPQSFASINSIVACLDELRPVDFTPARSRVAKAVLSSAEPKGQTGRPHGVPCRADLHGIFLLQFLCLPSIYHLVGW